jgi:ribosomal protein S18 acetylase RimI-like enzyme
MHPVPPRTSAADATPQSVRALESLVRAFSDDPLFTFVFPRAERRARDLRRLFAGSLRHAARVGGVATVEGGLGAAVWTPRDAMRVSIHAAWRAGMITLPFAIGPSAFRRLDRYEQELDVQTESAAVGDFAYLWMLGAHPDAQGRGLGRAAIENAFTAMRARGFHRCVLRTQQPRNISLYHHLGFDELARYTPAWTPLETIIFSRQL